MGIDVWRGAKQLLALNARVAKIPGATSQNTPAQAEPGRGSLQGCLRGWTGWAGVRRSFASLRMTEFFCCVSSPLATQVSTGDKIRGLRRGPSEQKCLFEDSGSFERQGAPHFAQDDAVDGAGGQGWEIWEEAGPSLRSGSPTFGGE